MSVILSCLGVVFSFAWFCVNRGSKYWQENWEKHVDVLEDEVTGPLYKVVLSRNPHASKADKFRNLLTGPSPLSVSKINQDRKSTRLNSSHVRISYAVFCLKKKKNKK